MFTRRSLLLGSTAALALRGATMTSKERVDRALRGEDVDRSPFSFWHHFLDASKPGEDHARSTLEFHEKFHTDLVKVMSDYPYPKPKAEWYMPKEEKNPFPQQIVALEKIRDGLRGQAYFVETLFNPWKVAENLSSVEEVRKLQREKPQALLDALGVIAKSEANHARRSIAAGAAGVFVAIANAQDGYMTQEDYAKFSEPFDKLIFDAVRTAPLNILHLHGDKVYLDRFYQGWQARAINYSAHGTGVPIAQVRSKYSGVILGGLDEVNYRKLTTLDLKRQWADASKSAGAKFILTPGCSVPNDSADQELSAAEDCSAPSAKNYRARTGWQIAAHNDAIDHAVFERLVGIENVVAIHVARDAIHRLAGTHWRGSGSAIRACAGFRGRRCRCRRPGRPGRSWKAGESGFASAAGYSACP